MDQACREGRRPKPASAAAAANHALSELMPDTVYKWYNAHHLVQIQEKAGGGDGIENHD